jgi:hypothetical protein
MVWNLLVTLREEQMLRVFQNRVARIHEFRGRWWRDAGEDCILALLKYFVNINDKALMSYQIIIIRVIVI